MENGVHPLPPIEDLLQEGQELLVEIAKEPIGTKRGPHHFLYHPPRTPPGLYADRRPYRHFAAHSNARGRKNACAS